jgi:hypothetical protein
MLASLGIDATQWRALVRTYVALDFRARGGAVRPEDRARRGASPLYGLLFVSAIGSLAFALVAAVTSDVLVSASLLTTYAAANTMMLLLVDFTSVVLSPDDYNILGHRPVDSRTYFAARLAAVGVYVGAVSGVLGLAPAVVYGVKLGAPAAPATLLAVLLCGLCTAVLVIVGYIVLLRWVHPARLRRAMSYLQLLAATSFYVVYYLAATSFQSALLDRVGFDNAPWLWVFPPTWFAALIVVAGGGAAAAAWAALGGAILVTAVSVPLAAGRLSLDYARRIGEMSAVGEPPRSGRGFHIPGFGRGEARAVALLVRAQFRYDSRFRMAVLGMLPLTGFYLLMGTGQGALQDPFSGATTQTGPGVFMAIVFIPMTLHAALTVSESWRAAWIFFSSPVSHARVVVAAKNFVAVYFLGGYLVVLAVVWAYYFDRVWHALVHALFAGLLAHILLQLTVIVKPALPFATEPRKGERSSMLFAVILVGSVIAGIFPFALSFVYRSAAVTAGALMLMVALTAAIEYALRLRVVEAIGDLEFRS